MDDETIRTGARTVSMKGLTLRRRKRCAGMTLVELMLALAGVGFISVAVTVMLSAVAEGTSVSQDIRGSVVRSKTVGARLSAALRSSRLLLDHGGNHVVFWVADTNDSGGVNLSEIRRIEWSSTRNEIWCFKAKFDDNLTKEQREQTDTAYELNEDFGQITSGLIEDESMEGEVWATDVSNWRLSYNNTAPEEATLISFRITLKANGLATTAIGAAALRNFQ